MVHHQRRLIDIIDKMCAGEDVFFHSVRLASDIMTTTVKTLMLDDTLEACLDFIRDNHCRHIPIVDTPTGDESKPYFVGVVSQRDVFRQISPYLGKLGEGEADQKALRQPVTQIVTRGREALSPDTPITTVLAAMLDQHVDIMPVVSGDDLVGLITTSDVVKVFVRLGAIRRLCREAAGKPRLIDLVSAKTGGGAAYFSTVFRTVHDIMTEAPRCLTAQDSLGAAIELMCGGKLRHLPIVDSKGKLVGIVSDRDVLRHLPSSRRPRAERSGEERFAVDPDEQKLALSLGRIMTPDVVHVQPDCTVYDAAQMLHEMRISGLPVVGEAKHVRGILTTSDLIRALLAAYRLADREGADAKRRATEGIGVA